MARARVARALLALAVVSLAPTNASGDEPGPPLLVRLASADAAVRATGYELMEGAAKTQLPAALTEIARLHGVDLERAAALRAELAVAVPALGTPAQAKALVAAIERWNAARAKARAAMYDEEKFPAPGPTVVMRGPYTGAAAVKSLLVAVEKAYAPLDAYAKAAQGLGDAKAQLARTDELGAIAVRGAERVLVLARHGRKASAVPDAPTDLAVRIKDLAAENPELALAEYEKLASVDRAVLFATYGRAISARAQKKAAELGIEGREGLERIDHMRLAFGLLPYELSAELSRSVGSHVVEMRDDGYFSHYSPNAARQTPSLRAKAAGFEGRTGECLATAGPLDAVAIWMWDGGHARIVYDASYEWVGLGWAACSPAQFQRWRSAGFCGINAGVGPATTWPRPEFYPVETK